MEIYTKIHNKWHSFNINYVAKNNYSKKKKIPGKVEKRALAMFLRYCARSGGATGTAPLSLTKMLAPLGARW